MRLSRQFPACLLFFLKKRFCVHKNTSQAKISEQNKNKVTLNNKGNNLLCARKLLTCDMFLCARNLFVKKINRLEIVLITSFYNTTIKLSKIFNTRSTEAFTRKKTISNYLVQTDITPRRKERKGK